MATIGNQQDKVLTVSVAAYNMSAFIGRCLDSCICGKCMDRLEVLVVDDGSSDDTADLAKQYSDRYPDTFRVVSKENGGYGSTVNLSMREATGKYFRLLDADDWFMDGSLPRMIGFLETCEADVVVTPMLRCVEGDGQHLDDKTFGMPIGKTIALADLPEEFFMTMWRLTVRTDTLKEDPFRLPKHCVFTDQLFVVNSLARARTCAFVDVPLYCYRVGRDGQTIAPESRIAHFEEIERVLLDELSFYETVSDTDVRRVLTQTVVSHYGSYTKLVLMMPRSRRNYNKIRGAERTLKERNRDVYDAAGKTRKLIKILRSSNYLAYWPLTFLNLKQKKYWEPKQ